MSREIVEEQVAVQITICRDNEGREWYRVDRYGEFVSRLVQTCEDCIPLVA